MTLRRFLAPLALVGLLAGCTGQATTGPNPYPPIPAPIAETLPKPPVIGEPLAWQPGHWDWNGSAYVWQPGQYVPAEGHGALWQPGWWSFTPGTGWSWQPAHWTS
jgi:hypothetical protein